MWAWPQNKGPKLNSIMATAEQKKKTGFKKQFCKNNGNGGAFSRAPKCVPGLTPPPRRILHWSISVMKSWRIFTKHISTAAVMCGCSGLFFNSGNYLLSNFLVCKALHKSHLIDWLKTKHVELGWGISSTFLNQFDKTTLNFGVIVCDPLCNHCVNQLTIFFCSLCHCSLTSFRSLSNSFFLVSRGWKHTSVDNQRV